MAESTSQKRWVSEPTSITESPPDRSEKWRRYRQEPPIPRQLRESPLSSPPPGPPPNGPDIPLPPSSGPQARSRRSGAGEQPACRSGFFNMNGLSHLRLFFLNQHPQDPISFRDADPYASSRLPDRVDGSRPEENSAAEHHQQGAQTTWWWSGSSGATLAEYPTCCSSWPEGPHPCGRCANMRTHRPRRSTASHRQGTGSSCHSHRVDYRSPGQPCPETVASFTPSVRLPANWNVKGVSGKQDRWPSARETRARSCRFAMFGGSRPRGPVGTGAGHIGDRPVVMHDRLGEERVRKRLVGWVRGFRP